MKRLILFRHAKSSWLDPQLPDSERPLSSRGEKDAPLMAARLAAHGERPAVIVSSHAKRALATARYAAAELGCTEDAVRVDRRLYLAPPEAILDVVRGQDDSAASLLIVGHNPGMTDLANRLVPDLALNKLPTAGIVALEVGTQHWAETAPIVCRLRYYDYPKRSG